MDTSDVCYYLRDAPDFDGDWDQRHDTAMPYCKWFERRVIPSVECGPFRCSAFVPASSNDLRIGEAQGRGSQKTLLERAALLNNLIQIKLDKDRLALAWASRSLTEYPEEEYAFGGYTINHLMLDIREHVSLLMRLGNAVPRLGNLAVSDRGGPITREYITEHVTELLRDARRCVTYKTVNVIYLVISVRWNVWSLGGAQYHERLPRLREVVADLERAVERYAD